MKTLLKILGFLAPTAAFSTATFQGIRGNYAVALACLGVWFLLAIITFANIYRTR